MKPEELKAHIQSLQNQLSESEIFELIMKMLAEGPEPESRNVLEAWLMGYAFCDWNRAAQYWQELLKHESAFERERAAMRLAILARKNRSSVAYQSIAAILGHDPTEDELANFVQGQGPST